MARRRNAKTVTKKTQTIFSPHHNVVALYLIILVFVPSILVSSEGYQYLFGIVWTMNVNNPDMSRIMINYKLVDNFGISRLILFTFVSLVTDIICQSGFIYNLYESKIRSAALYFFYQNVVFMTFSIIYIIVEYLTKVPKVYNYNILFFIVKNVINGFYLIYTHTRLKNGQLLPF